MSFPVCVKSGPELVSLTMVVLRDEVVEACRARWHSTPRDPYFDKETLSIHRMPRVLPKQFYHKLLTAYSPLVSSPIFRRISSLFASQSRSSHSWNKSYRRAIMKGKFSPPVNRNMTALDRSFFKKSVPLLVALFTDPKNLGNFVKAAKDDILLMPSVKHIVFVNGKRGVLLRDDIDDINNYKEKLSAATLEKMEEFSVTVEPFNLDLDYSFWKADDILQAILPEALADDVPTGFAQAGHIAHFNLRNDFKKYGPLIGQVILDKNSKIETVVDKVDTIDTKFRTFKMNILAGKDDFLVEQSESGCKFRFDFSSVYWNSRLSTEHDRIISQFQPGEVVGDVFAGVGPFAVPAGRKDVLVLANDLNPESYKYLKENIEINHVSDFVRPYNLDGRDFIRQSPNMLLEWAKQGAIEKLKTIKRRKMDEVSKQVVISKEVEKKRIEIPHFITNYAMNLPDSAITFLDEFVGLYSRDPEVEKAVKSAKLFRLPVINVHCFEKFSAEEPEPTMEELHRRIHARIVDRIGHSLPFERCKFHLVRKVAPTKPMFCVTFVLPEEVAFRK